MSVVLWFLAILLLPIWVLVLVSVLAISVVRKFWLVIFAVGALLSADLLTLQVTRELLDSESRRSTGAVALLAIASVSAAASAFVLLRSRLEELWQRLPEIDDNLRRNSLSFDRILSFCLFMIVAGITSYFSWKHLHQGDPDSKVAIALLTATFVALLFAVWGRDLVRRLQKVGTAGIEFGVWQEIARIPELAEPPRPHFDTETDPWGRRKLSSKQRWFYESGSNLLSHLSHLGVRGDELEGGELRRYRRIVLWVGIAALNERESAKAFEILKTIESLRNLDYEEQFYLGTAYLWVALDEQDQSVRQERMSRSSALLEGAVTQRPDQAPARFALAYVCDELYLYDQSIRQNREAIRLDPGRFHPWATCNLAISLLKQNDPGAALDALEDIQPGKWWIKICKDKELEELKDHPRFIALCRANAGNPE